ncbi:MAG: HlyC/CorC family transporter [Clostridium sp.]|nr:HlyC/CorC family transporter [Clostridium sp.]MBO6149740.1 HlyC/CorC family transporter [Clostridium sp.]
MLSDLENSELVRLCILLVLLILSGFFSASETALTTVNRIRLINLQENGDKRAKTVLRVLDDRDRMLSAILICNNIVNLYASSLATMLAADLWGSRAVGAATGILTLAVLVFGEISPKTASTYYSEEISLRVAGIIWFLMWLLTPVIVIVNRLSHLVLALLHVDLNRRGDTITEDELRTMVEVSHQDGEIEEREKTMINNVFDFGDAVARDVMVPRVDMIFISVNADYEELMRIFREEKYTRFPVYEETADNVIGILNIKDIFLREDGEDFDLRKYLRKPLYTYEFKNISSLMLEMRRSDINIVIVLDEYGVTAGLITLEDMLEEIVGEIHDEYDADEENNVRRVSDREYLVEGSMSLDDLDDRLGLSLTSEEYDSIGGLMIDILGRFPKEGESVTVDNVRLQAERVEGSRIDQVRLFLRGKVREKTIENAQEKAPEA